MIWLADKFGSEWYFKRLVLTGLAFLVNKPNTTYSKAFENIIRTSNGLIYAFDQKTRGLKIVQDFRK